MLSELCKHTCAVPCIQVHDEVCDASLMYSAMMRAISGQNLVEHITEMFLWKQIPNLDMFLSPRSQGKAPEHRDLVCLVHYDTPWTWGICSPEHILCKIY